MDLSVDRLLQRHRADRHRHRLDVSPLLRFERKICPDSRADAGADKIDAVQNASIFNQPRGWFIAHLAAGALSLLIALLLVSGNKPPQRPIQWMKVNLFVLLIALFLGSASRGARQNLFQVMLRGESVARRA